MTAEGSILGVDPGGRRVGVAIADLHTRFARPLEVVAAAEAVDRIRALVAELDVRAIVVGKPVGLSGRAGPAMAAQRDLVVRLEAVVPVPVEEFDERLTTVVAESGLRAAGAGARRRKEFRDAVAAQVMLQGYLDSRP